ncbi:MAG: ABC transporter ATP-binding protein [Acidimicrobiales bacterium]|nr:ABC transporter ATP-binding protein [Acidimicrobiales bacterium]
MRDNFAAVDSRLIVPILETTGLKVTYGSFTAADDISISVGEGEIYGLLGPNGAGKTSIIRALTTIIPIASGSATIAGHPLTDAAAVRASIGVLPESNGYPSAQTGRSYLRFYGQLFGLSREAADLRAERLLHQLGLGKNHSRISTFSRGMRQRLGLARALINDPAVLFLDEPTLGLDPAGKEDIMAHLTKTAVESGTSVILCSHLLDEVERVCDRIAIMDRGRIVAEGTVEEVVATSGAAGTARVRIAPEDIGRADAALRSSFPDATIGFDNTRPGELDVPLTTGKGARSELLRCLLAAGVDVLALDLRGVRLSDAFLGLTDATAPQRVRKESS